MKAGYPGRNCLRAGEAHMGVLRFEGFTLDVAGGVLMRDGKPLALRRQPFKVLVYLAEGPAGWSATRS